MIIMNKVTHWQLSYSLTELSMVRYSFNITWRKTYTKEVTLYIQVILDLIQIIIINIHNIVLIGYISEKKFTQHSQYYQSIVEHHPWQDASKNTTQLEHTSVNQQHDMESCPQMFNQAEHKTLHT